MVVADLSDDSVSLQGEPLVFGLVVP